MMSIHRIGYTILTLGTLAACAGCPFRKERITVTADGSVLMRLQYQGSAEELERFDALPSRETGWKVKREIKKQDQAKDDETQVLTAERRFAPGEPLPRNLAKENDPEADLYLDFPTTLTIEDRADGRYFHFRRTYTPRRWAYVQYWHDSIEDEIKKLGDKPVEELTRDDRLKIVQAFGTFEAFTQLEFAKEALAELEPELPPQYGLLARQALLSVYEEKHDHFRPLLDLCEDLTDDRKLECYGREADRILAEGYDAYIQSLSDSGLEQDQQDAFHRSYQRAKRFHQITNELGAHGFEIEVQMPGAIVAHNGEKVREGEDGNVAYVTWTFDGRAFRDRPVEMIVISRMDHDSAGKRRHDVGVDRK